MMKKEALKNLKNSCILQHDDQIVFGEGHEDAKIILVGEAPGAKEEELGRPFVGKAGKNLDAFLEVLELERSNIYITNIVKKRPYKINEKTKRKSNRPPYQSEIEDYISYIQKEIEIISPEVIVTLGNTPLRALVGNKKISIGEVHGEALNYNENISIFPLYHPASIIYNRDLKIVYEQDLLKLKSYLKEITDLADKRWKVGKA